ncbi:MAG: DUF1566 domain-containing protein, partial [Pseudomonadota bacterium]
TDVDGHTVVKVSDTEGGSVDIIAHVTRPNGEVVESSTASVTFADVPSGNYPCPGGGFACLPVLPSINNPDVWYTPDPDVTYLEKIKYSRSDYTDTYPETRQYGLPGFRGVLFNHTGQAERWCQYLAQNHYHGRSDWTLPSKESLVSLYNEYKAVSASNALFTAKSWPTGIYYWSSSPSGSDFYDVDLSNGGSDTRGASDVDYVSCVSE